MTVPPPPPARSISPDEQSLVAAIQDVARVLKAWIGAEMRREGLTGPMFWALHEVASAGPITVGQLGGACGVTSAMASQVADDLERAGLLARTRSSTDRRVVMVETTAKGRALQRSIWTRVGMKIMEPLRESDPRDVAVAARLLQRLAQGAVDRVAMEEARA